MSILLLGLDDDLVQVLSQRLIRQDDEVRILVTGGASEKGYEGWGIHVARGPHLDDADLIERACQNVRTLVIGDRVQPLNSEVVEAIVSGAKAAGVDRLIVVGPQSESELLDRAGAARLEFVMLRTPKAGLLRRSRLDLEDVAEAIDAADDVAEEMGDELDLSDPAAWERLKLVPR